MRKKVDKDNASLPIPNKRKEKENKASPPTLSLERGRGRGFLAPFIHVLFNSVPILPNFHKKAKASLRQVLSLIYFPRKICNFAAINPLTNEQRME
ncbi:hypothetical protein [Segatella oris]|uniref:hypothetical protein n=1 Tax=Segatella oris TaxID=28135 RepID=UPI003609494C